MVLSNYIATQNCCRTSQIFLSHYLSFFWKRVFFFLIFLKNKMQHIPIVSHALWRGTLSLVKTVDVVPTTQNNWLIPSTGLSVFIYRGRRASQDLGSGSRKRAAERLRLRRDVFSWDSWSCPCCPLPVVVHKRSFQGRAGQQWFLCTFSRVVPTFLFLFLISTHPPKCRLSLFAAHSTSSTPLQNQPASCPFLMQLYLAKRPDILTAKKWKKENKNNFIICRINSSSTLLNLPKIKKNM